MECQERIENGIGKTKRAMKIKKNKKAKERLKEANEKRGYKKRGDMK